MCSKIKELLVPSQRSSTVFTLLEETAHKDHLSTILAVNYTVCVVQGLSPAALETATVSLLANKSQKIRTYNRTNLNRTYFVYHCTIYLNFKFKTSFVI